MSLISAFVCFAFVVHIDSAGTITSQVQLPKQIEPGEVVWTWSADCAPQRLETLPPGDCATTDTIAIRVRTQERLPVKGAIVRWGTEQMLRELPDSLLPEAVADESGITTLRVPAGLAVFARVAGPVLASQWMSLHQPETTFTAVRGIDVHIRVADASRALSQAHLLLRTTDIPQIHDLAFNGSGNPAIAIPAIPAGSYVRGIAWSDSDCPTMFSGHAGRLPSDLTLKPGVVLRGRAVDAKKHPVASVLITATARIPPIDSLERHALSDRKGVFLIRGLDLREVKWTARKNGYGVISRITNLADRDDLGDVVLTSARDVRVTVLDQRRDAIPDAAIRTADGITARTNRQGIAILKQAPANAFNAIASAVGHLAREFRIGSEPAASVTLRDAARVRATIVRASDNVPAGPGTIGIELDGRQTILDFDASGKIDVADLEAGNLSIEIRARGVAPFRIPARRIAEGEQLDFGIIRLPSGNTIMGRLVDAESNTPLEGATIHALRPSTFGPLLSYARQDWASAQSAADGTFRVDGLSPGVYALAIEATGHAPLTRTGIEIGPTPDHDLGDLPIPIGHTLNIHCEPADRCGSRAAVVLGDAEWMPLGAFMDHGNATIEPIAAGPATLRLLDESGIIRETPVTIADHEPVTDVRIHIESVTVQGVLYRGGKPVVGGTLLFRTRAAGHFIQIDHKDDAGSLGSDFLGVIPRTWFSEVSDDGHFVVQDATPGEYEVMWSFNGSQSPPLRVAIPEGAAQTPLHIELPGAAIEGTVRTIDGAPLSSVLVLIGQDSGPAQTFARPDGTFSVAGLTRGTATIAARSHELRAQQTITLDEGRTTHVDLILQPHEDRVVVLSVHVANAFVFMRRNGSVIATTSASDGTATFHVPDDRASADFAVYSPLAGWAFLPPTDALSLQVDFGSPSAALIVSSTGARKPVALTAPTGFPIHEALMLLGIPSIAPCRLDRLPAGTYSAASQGVTKTIDLSDHIGELTF